MTDRPILMSAPMVRALLDGRKTQTRRLAWRPWRCTGCDERNIPWNMVTFQEEHDARYGGCGEDVVSDPTIWQSVKPGDRLWVRETWAVPPELNHLPPREIWAPGKMPTGGIVAIPVYGEGYPSWQPWPGTKWRPSIHMPRWASRITLVVTATKRERVRNISHDDAIREGLLPYVKRPVDRVSDTPDPIEVRFRNLWQSLHTKPGARWDDNPEVVVLTFTVHKRNIDAMDNAQESAA